MPLILFLLLLAPYNAMAGLITDPVTVPSLPVQPDPTTCHLDLSSELFGGVSEACGRTLDRSRCCPVLAAWLFAAHARSALQLTNTSTSSSSVSSSDLMPMMPDDSQKCVNSLQSSLLRRRIRIPQPNATCDAVLCFCGIRLHQIASLRCPAAFNVTKGKDGKRSNVVATAAVKGLERSCGNASYSGCSKCLGALQKIKGEDNTTGGSGDSRGSKMLDRDCQLMGLTWLLARNKSAYIPTVSAVLRAILYSSHSSHDGATTTCSPDQENMPLAVDSLQFTRADSDSSSTFSIQRPGLSFGFKFPVLPLVMVMILEWVMG
ncbi:hypothetical protein Droror1_Dr00019351 [Drosera rotundifolia]